MKKALCFTLILLVYPLYVSSAFEERPALSRKAKAVLYIARAVGGLLGATAGIPLAYYGARSYYQKEQIYIFSGAVACAMTGATIGATCANSMANMICARRHKVNVRAERVSRYYAINIDQYWPLVQAAIKKDAKALNNAITECFNEHFGQSWQADLEDLLLNYPDFAAYLRAVKKKKMNKKEADLIRIIELGAALENIYFGSKISRKLMIAQAQKMFPFIGFNIAWQVKEGA